MYKLHSSMVIKDAVAGWVFVTAQAVKIALCVQRYHNMTIV